MPSHVHLGLESWECPVAPTLTLALIAFVYVRGWLNLRSTFPNAVPTRRAGGVLLGLLLIWVAMASPLASCDAGSLTVHMVQHLLLMTFAPPLIFLGDPFRVLGHGLPSRLGPVALAPLFRWPPLQRLGSALAEPVVCWVAATATLVGWHVPAFFTLALQSHAWHAVEHASFLGTGLLFWWPVIQPWPSASTGPRWSTVLYLFLATLPCDILSGFLVFSDRVAYSVYLSTPGHTRLSILDDQQCAGALMWTCVTIVYLVAGTVLSTQLLTTPSRAPLRPADPRRLEVA
jgi:cytochrome c oxidase assembly factor CtaG